MMLSQCSDVPFGCIRTFFCVARCQHDYRTIREALFVHPSKATQVVVQQLANMPRLSRS